MTELRTVYLMILICRSQGKISWRSDGRGRVLEILELSSFVQCYDLSAWTFGWSVPYNRCRCKLFLSPRHHQDLCPQSFHIMTLGQALTQMRYQQKLKTSRLRIPRLRVFVDLVTLQKQSIINGSLLLRL